jgi:hypothetical protein
MRWIVTFSWLRAANGIAGDPSLTFTVYPFVFRSLSDGGG